ncbi:MAG: DNA-directed RNA polymerase subunit H [Candidatus Aenigmarchaeota archaeon]|nr:DNA-directed RNA polymerase subunit H [Candidatus Aenigmarchaeota archaeon]MBU5688866.1 DNA-directed RNA polymerase subunit H [Candidatus Aenigmarchaeota archaeon]
MLKQENKIDVLSHELVPKHYIVSEDEKQKVMEKYRITKMNQFPQIKASDPAVRAIGAKPGDLIKIIRKSNIAKEVVYYRLVVEE